jgi:hypothetical protein
MTESLRQRRLGRENQIPESQALVMRFTARPGDLEFPVRGVRVIDTRVETEGIARDEL